jgi:hypothetical protein
MEIKRELDTIAWDHPSSILLRPYLSLARHALLDSLKSRFDAHAESQSAPPGLTRSG